MPGLVVGVRRAHQVVLTDRSVDSELALSDERSDGSIGLVELAKRPLMYRDRELGGRDVDQLRSRRGSELSADRYERHNLPQLDLEELV